MIKVQCISTIELPDSGFHDRLEIGMWYDAEEWDGNKNSYIIHGLGKKEHPLDADYGLYDKSLFRTLQDKRDSLLDKIL